MLHWQRQLLFDEISNISEIFEKAHDSIFCVISDLFISRLSRGRNSVHWTVQQGNTFQSLSSSFGYKSQSLTTSPPLDGRRTDHLIPGINMVQHQNRTT